MVLDTAELNKLKDRVCAEIDTLREEAEFIATDMHQHPEVGWDTPRSAGLLTDYMERHGMKVEKGLAGLACSFRGSIRGREDQRPGISLLAEYDALPGLGHACSHNLIGTAAATAGIALSRVLSEHPAVPGNVYVMGTPFEEGGGGKIIMLEHGVFDVADASIMFHGSNRIQVGSPNIAAVSMTYTFHGRSAHSGASPHEGINAADAAMITFTAVNALRQHLTSDVRVHGIINEAGVAANIVPERAVVTMMARARTKSVLEEVVEKVNNCARAGALATGCQLEIEQGPVFAERVVVPSYRPVALENMRRLKLDPPTDDPQTFASADSGNVSYAMPHLTFTLPLDDRGSVPHTPEFAEACNSRQGREAMLTAAKIMAMTALDLMTDPELLQTIKAEHRQLVGR